MQAVYNRTRLTGVEDVAVTTHDFYAPDAGDFTDAWMDAIAAQYGTFWQGLLTGSWLSSRCTLKELRFYDDYNGDGTPGTVDRVVPMTQTAGSLQMVPPQIACSITELLGPGSRRHWGRFYLPGMSQNALDADGAWAPTFVTAVANGADTLYDAWTTVDYYPGVWVGSGTLFPTPPGDCAPVREIRVDNIPDVIRRRRYEAVTQRETRAIT